MIHFKDKSLRYMRTFFEDFRSDREFETDPDSHSGVLSLSVLQLKEIESQQVSLRTSTVQVITPYRDSLIVTDNFRVYILSNHSKHYSILKIILTF